jgi:hypothetical protein
MAVFGVITDHWLDKALPIGGNLLVFHEFIDRIHRPGEQHGLCAHLKHLHDMGRLLSPIGGNGCSKCF